MPTPEEISETITSTLVTAAEGPKKVKGDAGEVEQQDLMALIEADRYFAARAAASKGARGIRFTKLIPPGID